MVRSPCAVLRNRLCLTRPRRAARTSQQRVGWRRRSTRCSTHASRGRFHPARMRRSARARLLTPTTPHPPRPALPRPHLPLRGLLPGRLLRRRRTRGPFPCLRRRPPSLRQPPPSRAPHPLCRSSSASPSTRRVPTASCGARVAPLARKPCSAAEPEPEGADAPASHLTTALRPPSQLTHLTSIEQVRGASA